jgi:hypothetical protein
MHTVSSSATGGIFALRRVRPVETDDHDRGGGVQLPAVVCSSPLDVLAMLGLADGVRGKVQAPVGGDAGQVRPGS